MTLISPEISARSQNRDITAFLRMLYNTQFLPIVVCVRNIPVFPLLWQKKCSVNECIHARNRNLQSTIGWRASQSIDDFWFSEIHSQNSSPPKISSSKRAIYYSYNFLLLFYWWPSSPRSVQMMQIAKLNTFKIFDRSKALTCLQHQYSQVFFYQSHFFAVQVYLDKHSFINHQIVL